MEIRRATTSSGPRQRGRAAPTAAGLLASDPAPLSITLDTFQDGARRQGAVPDGAPFWLVTMAADRRAGRQYLSAAARREAELLEQSWIDGWVSRLAAPVSAIDDTGLDLPAWQAYVQAACLAAGLPLSSPLVVWQSTLSCGRGQYLFRVDRSLIQLRRGAPGSAAEWLATVAHETFHHAQQELVTALYRGSPGLASPFDRLATYYRDARIAYHAASASCPPEFHRRQDLERGAWRFGEAVAKTFG